MRQGFTNFEAIEINEIPFVDTDGILKGDAHFTFEKTTNTLILGQPGGPEGYGYGYGEEGASIGSLILYGDLYVDDDVVFAEDVIIGGSLTVNGKLTVTGLIDPTGLQFDPIASNPGNNYTLWINSSDSNKIYLGSSQLTSLANPAGSNGEIQYNDGGVFAADSNFTWDAITGLVVDKKFTQTVTAASSTVLAYEITAYAASGSVTEVVGCSVGSSGIYSGVPAIGGSFLAIAADEQAVAIQGAASNGTDNFGVIGSATGVGSGVVNYGGYFTATGASGATSWSLYTADGNISFGGNVFTRNNYIQTERSVSSTPSFQSVVTGDVGSARFCVRADGYLEWGDGTTSRDVSLYRSAANSLKTDDAFIVADTTVSTSSTTGAVVIGGGLGVGEKVCIGDTTAATAVDTGALQLQGGWSAKQNSYQQGMLKIESTDSVAFGRIAEFRSESTTLSLMSCFPIVCSTNVSGSMLYAMSISAEAVNLTTALDITTTGAGSSSATCKPIHTDATDSNALYNYGIDIEVSTPNLAGYGVNIAGSGNGTFFYGLCVSDSGNGTYRYGLDVITTGATNTAYGASLVAVAPTVYGVYSVIESTTNGYAGYFEATGSSGTKYGVYATASGTGVNWAGYFVQDVYIGSDLTINGLSGSAGSLIIVDANGKLELSSSSIASVYKAGFTNASLVGGVLTVNHSLGTQYVNVQVFDENDQLINPNDVTLTDADNLNIDLSAYGTISGTWNVIIVG